MNKNNFLNHIAIYKTHIALLGVLLMVTGFLIGRAYLSLGMMITGGVALLAVHPKEWFRARWWLAGVLWLAWLALTYFWTDNKDLYGTTMQVKLPILLLPLAFYLLPAFSIRHLKIFTAAVMLMLLAGVAYSLQYFFADPAAVIEGYRYSKSLPTPAYNDHIRFSLFVTLFIIWCIGSFRIWKSMLAKTLIIIGIIILAAYLHILAAKTGLLAFYIFILGWGIYLTVKKNFKVGIVVLLLIIAGGWLGVKYVPTLAMKVNYVKYTLEMYQKGEVSGKYSDMGRAISYDIAWRLIKENPATGVGTGDVFDRMKDGYDKWYPHIPEESKLYPHNQFLVVALGGGIPALLLFSVWIMMPLFVHRRAKGQRFYLYITWLVVLMLLMIEPALEVQMGVFVYLFFLLWQMYACAGAANKKDRNEKRPEDDEFYTRIST